MNTPDSRRMHEENASRMSHLESRVTGIETKVDAAIDALKGIGTKLDARSATPWPTILSAMGVLTGVLVALGGALYQPIHANQDRLERSIEKLADNVVGRKELEGRWREQALDIDEIRRWIGRLDQRLDRRIERIEGLHFKP